jgi:sortase A
MDQQSRLPMTALQESPDTGSLGAESAEIDPRSAPPTEPPGSAASAWPEDNALVAEPAPEIEPVRAHARLASPRIGWIATIGSSPSFRIGGISLLLLSIFLLGFAAYLFGFSGTVEARSQVTLYTQLRSELSQAIAPTGPTTSGQPVAILDFPTIGTHNLVVVEGTTPQNLMLGPGLVRNGPLPGQAGVATIYGRLATFGAPFSRLGQLHLGDEIKAITGQGVAVYKVVAFGDSHHEVVNQDPNQLVLLTAGSPYIPTYYSYMDADLVSAVQPQSGTASSVPIYTDEIALSGDEGALVIALLWGLALAGVSALSTVAAARWSPWPAYLAAAPVVLVVAWNLYQNLAALLPNVY